ncbi:hypothetical protein [Nonomuraea sp. LPB2021202275-12-8]|uniref:hypothetical protein n=1 Tax=Nonomuraea sp. LPB2021202275-12-8 TaxID=3120159 RepID=UPI00300C187D
MRSTGQATAYANQLSARFGYPAGTYKAIVAWDDPEAWGSSHKCGQQALGDLKKKQTNGIVYNTRTLSLAASDISKYWTMHLPEQNGGNACAGAGYTGIGNSGIHVGADATSLLNASTIRVIGIDANRTNIAPTTLGGFGVTGYGAKATAGSRKIDYLFVKGAVQPSSIDHTVSSTKSNHLALYGFIRF